MKKTCVILMIGAAFFLAGCSKEAASGGKVLMLSGKTWIISGDSRREARVGDFLRDGDAVETGERSVAVLELAGGTAAVELQEKALFRIESMAGKDRLVYLDRGNLWIKVHKVLKEGSFKIKTRTSVAAVRGTKMYHFTMGEMAGICHCEGDVDYSGIGSHYGKVHHRDSIVLTKGGVTVLLSPEELSFMLPPGTEHRHSMLENSPLGLKAVQPEPKEQKRLAELIGKAFEKAGLPKTGR